MSTRARRRSRCGRLAAIALPAMLACGVAAAGASDRTLTRADAQAAATAISLRGSDLPTLAAQSNPVTTQQRRFSAQLTACLGGVPNGEAYAVAQSPSFTGSGSSSLSVSSSTEILPSARLVAKDLAAVASPRGIPCLRRQLGAQLKATLPKSDTLQIEGQPLAGIVPARDGSFALRFDVLVGIKQAGASLSLPLFYDAIGFAFGQAEVGLDVLTSTTKPSLQLEQRLAATLLARARSAIGG